MTAAVLADALDTAGALFWAGAGWLILTCLAAALALHALAVAAVWAPLAAWRALRGAVRLSQRLTAPESPRIAHDVSGGRTEPHPSTCRPSWAHTDKEAA